MLQRYSRSSRSWPLNLTPLASITVSLSLSSSSQLNFPQFSSSNPVFSPLFRKRDWSLLNPKPSNPFQLILYSTLGLCHLFLKFIVTVAGARWESVAKKPKMMTTGASLTDAFSKYADYLNNLNEKRERVVKASRDITMNSKKVIFQVHRIGKHNKDEVLEKAEKDLQAVRDQHVSRLAKELNGTDFWKLRRAFSPGVQEYVEAATFCKFCRTGTLLNLDEINATFLQLSDPSIEPLQINILDYLLGLADLTGELMRLAISRISDGELDFADKICRFVRDLHRELTIIVPDMDDSHDMKFKMDTMLQSVMKIENACFSVHVRGSEYIPLLGANDPSFSLMGVSDMEL